MVSLLFPGQGSQTPGMGKAIADAYPAAREIFARADDALETRLSTTCFEGPAESLRRTEITQPALLTTSIATLRALESERPDLRIGYAAGHSLGEWSALVAVGALSFEDAVRLVQTRGRLMQSAVPEGVGAMAAVIGLTAERVEEVCREATRSGAGDTVEPANYNSPEQTVISGHARAVARATDALSKAGAKRIIPLEVSAPFHCALMKPAADGVATALEPVDIRPLTAPVISNVEATPNPDPARVKNLLVRQVTAPVRWSQSTRALLDAGETTALELGPGTVLKGLARRIDRALRVWSISEPEDITKALAALDE